MHDGVPVANVGSPVLAGILAGTSLPADLTRLVELRVQPMALAQFLLSVPDEVLERTGAIFMDELRRSRQSSGVGR
jgi:hypothetical protein